MCLDKRQPLLNRRPMPHRPLSAILALVLLWAASAGAVDKGKTSYTAEAVCAFRSIGATDPDPKTRNPDNLAKSFVNPQLMNRIPGLGLDYEDAKIAIDRMNSGVFYYVNARTHHMDAKLHQALKDGARQVVIMGAGFDSRAYRFHKTYPTVRFFEIDLPATSLDKQKRVEKIFGRKPDWVTYVPIDFNTQSLEEVLGKAGFSRDTKTFYVWEGVTYFISREAVRGTLNFIATHSAPGSRIVFDYMLEDVVQGMDYSAHGARRTVFFVAMMGEPYIFGIAPNQVETFVNRSGLALLSDLGPADLTRRYLIHGNGKVSGKIAEFLRIVHLEVPKNDERRRLMALSQRSGKAASSAQAPPAPAHLVNVPDDVQTFLTAYSNGFLNEDLSALSDQYSDRYLYRGRTKEMTVSYLGNRYMKRPIRQHKIILTKLEQKGNRATVDGFIVRRGYRIPLMIHHIIKEADGRWRWLGNQQQ